MKHLWERSSCCSYCGWHCPRCNDCQCPGNGWKKYEKSACPGFDTNTGQDRPPKTENPY